jgi:nitrogenase molybdenum-iron protein alpha/beta subunit
MSEKLQAMVHELSDLQNAQQNAIVSSDSISELCKDLETRLQLEITSHSHTRYALHTSLESYRKFKSRSAVSKQKAAERQKAAKEKQKSAERAITELSTRTVSLKYKSVFTQETRDLCNSLTSQGVAESKVDPVIKAVAKFLGTSVEGSIAPRSVGRFLKEGFVASQLQIGHEIEKSSGRILDVH